MNITKSIRNWLNIPNEEEEKEMALQMQSESVADFERVIYTLSSSIHEAHIETAVNMFSAFKNKWGVLPKSIMEYNEVIFNREKQKVLNTLLAKDIAYNMSRLLETSFEKKNVELLLT